MTQQNIRPEICKKTLGAKHQFVSDNYFVGSC